MLIYITFLLALNNYFKNSLKPHSYKISENIPSKICKLLMGEKTVIFVNSCIKFAALCGISGPAANEPAHFFVSFLCANKEMKNNFSQAFSKS